MAKEVNATFHEVFSDISLADLVRLIPWYIYTTASHDVIPVHHLGKALATAMQPGVDGPAVTLAPGSEDPQVLAPMSSPAHDSETAPPPILPLSDVPSIGTPPVGCLLVGFLIDSQNAKQMVHLAINLGRGPILKLLKLKSAVDTAYHRAAKNYLKCHQKCMTMAQVPWIPSKSTKTKTALIMVVISQPRMN